mgnify:CR=1 FL=1
MTHAFARAALRRVAATVGVVALVATAAFDVIAPDTATGFA